MGHCTAVGHPPNLTESPPPTDGVKLTQTRQSAVITTSTGWGCLEPAMFMSTGKRERAGDSFANSTLLISWGCYSLISYLGMK